MPEASNPLLSYAFEVPFDAISAEHVEEAVDTLLGALAARLRPFRDVSGPRTYDNTLGALDAATEELEHAMADRGPSRGRGHHAELRDAYNAVQPKVSEFYAGIPLDEGLYRRAQGVRRDAPRPRRSSPREARFLKQDARRFQAPRRGARSAEKKRALRAST